MCKAEEETTKEVAKTKGKGKKGEEGEKAPKIVVQLGPPNVTEGENVFAVVHILATWNGRVKSVGSVLLDTFIHVTDLTGRETLIRVTGGMKVKADREEASPYAAMQAAKDVVDRLKDLKINALHVKLRGRGGKSYFQLTVFQKELTPDSLDLEPKQL